MSSHSDFLARVSLFYLLIFLDKGYDSEDARIKVSFYLMLPNPHHFPSHLAQFSNISPVSLSVFPDFFSPKARELVLPLREAVPVPKVTVDKYRNFSFRKDEIGAAWECFHVLSESVPSLMQLGSDRHLQTTILQFDPRHSAEALLWSEVIGHCAVFRQKKTV